MSWISTYSGNKLDLLNPDPKDINIADMAQGLALTCRWNGQLNYFFSVAQHSCLMATILRNDPVLRLYALLHDSAEAYVGDIVSPLKPYINNFKEIEDRILQAILNKYGLSLPLPPEIKVADNRMCLTEALKLRSRNMVNPVGRWETGELQPYDMNLHPWRWEIAKQRWWSQMIATCTILGMNVEGNPLPVSNRKPFKSKSSHLFNPFVKVTTIPFQAVAQ